MSVVQPAGEDAEERVEAADVGGVEDDRDEHDDREAADLGPLGPGHLAHLVAHLAEVLRGDRPAPSWQCAAQLGARGLALLVQGTLALQLSASAHGSGRRVTSVRSVLHLCDEVVRWVWAGQEGLEPPTVGFGDRCSTS